VRTRVTVVAGLALTAAVLLGLAVMYPLQLGSADRTVQSQLRAYAAQVEAAPGSVPRPRPEQLVQPRYGSVPTEAVAGERLNPLGRLGIEPGGAHRAG
jgi:hypothetical protein